jgi:peptide chain release factor 2
VIWRSGWKGCRSIFDLEKMNQEISEIEKKMRELGFWDNRKKAKKQSTRLNHLKDILDPYQELVSDLSSLSDLIKLDDRTEEESILDEILTEVERFDQKLTDLEINVLLGGEHDSEDALINIHPGAGGTESQDWAEMLLRLYRRYLENHSFDYRILDLQPGDEAGIKNATLEVKGEYPYGRLKSESGIHRLVRISPFDAGKRRHTSFASVFVYPEIDEDIEVEINPDDIRIDTYRASGAGGQHVNKVSSAVRITHFPSGIVVQCQNERSQHRNREMAMKVLRSRLYTKLREEEKIKKDRIAGEKKDISWGNQIRSYIFQPYTLVKDHRTGVQTGNINAVMDGNIDEFINGYLRWNERKK